jgi:hypothetical protein
LTGCQYQALLGAQAADTQMSLAAIMLRMNASAAIADVLEKASQNLTSLANAGPGVGQNVNISA